MEKRKKRKIYIDYSLIFAIFFLIIFGAIMIYSASSYISTIKNGDPMYFMKKQMWLAALGIAAMVFAAFFDYHIYISKPFIYFFYPLSVILCVLVMFVGRMANGKRRWFSIGGMSFQPSELAKVMVILVLVYFIVRNKTKFEKSLGVFTESWIKVAMLIFIPAGIVAITNLSSAIIIIMIGFVLLYVSVKNKRYLFRVPAIGVTFLYLVLTIFATSIGNILANSSGGYRIKRFLYWLLPERYATEGGYQVLQSLYAVASGGLMGKGLGQSLQKFHLPEAQNDMIFAIICEELGLFGASVIVVLFMFVLFRMWDIAKSARDLEGSLIVVGVMSQIAIQLILNIAVVTNAMPNTGISLPFISYGGSSLVILLGEIGMVLSVAKGIRQEY